MVQKQDFQDDFLIEWSTYLRDARTTQGILSHHDAVTGTARKKVTTDYLTM